MRNITILFSYKNDRHCTESLLHSSRPCEIRIQIRPPRLLADGMKINFIYCHTGLVRQSQILGGEDANSHTTLHRWWLWRDGSLFRTTSSHIRVIVSATPAAPSHRTQPVLAWEPQTDTASLALRCAKVLISNKPVTGSSGCSVRIVPQ